MASVLFPEYRVPKSVSRTASYTKLVWALDDQTRKYRLWRHPLAEVMNSGVFPLLSTFVASDLSVITASIAMFQARTVTSARLCCGDVVIKGAKLGRHYSVRLSGIEGDSREYVLDPLWFPVALVPAEDYEELVISWPVATINHKRFWVMEETQLLHDAMSGQNNQLLSEFQFYSQGAYNDIYYQQIHSKYLGAGFVPFELHGGLEVTQAQLDGLILAAHDKGRN